MRKIIWGIGIIFITILLAIPIQVFSYNKQISSSSQLTTDPKYDRNPEILKANEGIYWLFYTCGRDTKGIRDLDGYNPDLDYYDIHYRTSKNLDELGIASDNIIPTELYPDNAQRDLAAVQSNNGKIWLFASTGLGPGTERCIYFYLYDGSWSTPTAIPGTDYAAHIDALVYRGKIWVFFDSGYTLKVTSYDGSVWSTPVDIHTDATIAKAIVADGTFYVVWTTASGTGIFLSTSPDGTTWLSTSTPIASWQGTGATNWDPVLIKNKGDFTLFWAPDIVTEQFIAMTVSTNPQDPASWSDPVRLTTANNWWDFWPQPIIKGDTIYLFYTSERNAAGTERIDGNIWLMKFSK